jgi:DNA polymerase III epsilon subunit-like protein
MNNDEAMSEAGVKKGDTFERQKQMRYAVHFNYNLVAVVDVETTGLDPKIHDVWQLCVLPLSSCFEPLKDVIPFEVLIRPRRLENYDRTNPYLDHKGIAKAMLEGFDAFKVIEMFETWFAKLQLQPKKKIIPLGQNYGFDKGFLNDLFGVAHYESFFDYHNRDSMSAALFLNDLADLNNRPIPYPHVSLRGLCQSTKTINDRPHDALSDCLATAAVYRQLLLRGV